MLSIVIPAYNEGGGVGHTLDAVRAALADSGIAPYEVVLVDDGSTDDTGAIALAAGARVVRHPHNSGYGHALKSGIEAAQYDMIAITDADGTYPVDAIPELVRRYREGFDMVVGARRGPHYLGSAIKRPMRLILRFLVEWTTGRAIPDINSGLRVFSRRTVLPYFPHLCDTFSFTTSLTLSYMMTRRFVCYLPVDYTARIGRSHVQMWRDSLRTLQFVTQAIVYYNPIKIFLLMSLLCLCGAAISIGVGIVFHLASGFMMAVGAIVAALLIFALGLLAELLRQIMGK